MEWKEHDLRGIPPDSACVFVSYDSAVYPYDVSVINLSHEHSYMLSPLSSSEPRSVRLVLGTPDTLVMLCFLSLIMNFQLTYDLMILPVFDIFLRLFLSNRR